MSNRRSSLQRTLHFFTHLTSGHHSPSERVRMIANNLIRRSHGGGCCGHYGEPGC